MKNKDESTNLNSKVIKKIVEQSPVKSSPVVYIMKMLSASRETAYRRIRNQIPFTLEEAVAIAEDLNMQVDELLDLKTAGNFPIINESNCDNEPENIYSGFLRSDIKTMEKLLKAKKMKMVAAINRIPLWLLPYKSLLKFDYCHYLYSIGKISMMTCYSDIVVPQDIMDLHRKASTCFSRLDNITCLIDRGILLDIVKKIQYYSRLKFIPPEDLEILQKELFTFLETYESLLRSGKNRFGSEYVFHYSYFSVDSNTVFLEHDDNCILQIRIYPENSLEIMKNPIIRDIQKKWINSKMRNSALITKANDTQHIEMLRNVHQQISELKAPPSPL
jgi:hypothetical protein